MPGTDKANGATSITKSVSEVRRPYYVLRAMELCACYAMSGTEALAILLPGSRAHPPEPAQNSLRSALASDARDQMQSAACPVQSVPGTPLIPR
eukprot:3524564-Rhodomonas_salina.1